MLYFLQKSGLDSYSILSPGALFARKYQEQYEATLPLSESTIVTYDNYCGIMGIVSHYKKKILLNVILSGFV